MSWNIIKHSSSPWHVVSERRKFRIYLAENGTGTHWYATLVAGETHMSRTYIGAYPGLSRLTAWQTARRAVLSLPLEQTVNVS